MTRPAAPVSGLWNAYVGAGATREERTARLSECPPELRAGVESHVRTQFQICARWEDPRFRAWAEATRAAIAAERQAAGQRKPSDPEPAAP